jgi:hypothetical protein
MLTCESGAPPVPQPLRPARPRLQRKVFGISRSGNSILFAPMFHRSAIPCGNRYQGCAQNLGSGHLVLVFGVLLTLWGGVDFA